MRRPLVILAVVALPLSALAACGGDDEPERAETAEEGSEFCERAAEAEVLGDAVNAAGTDPAALEEAVGAALTAADAVLELAPTDIVEPMTDYVAYQREIAEMFERNDWDLIAAAATEDGAALLGDEARQNEAADIRAYLEDKCGIVDDSDAGTDSSTAPADTSAGSGTPIDLPDGEAGIDRFIDLYAIGTGTEVTDEQRQCLKDALEGKVTVEQLEQLAGGAVDEDAQVAVGLAFISCDVLQA